MDKQSEYKEFQQEFRKCYQEEVKPRLYRFEVERRKKHKLAKTLTGILATISSAIFLYLLLKYGFFKGFERITIILVIITCAPYWIISNNFKQQMKEKFMNILLKPFKTFEWTRRRRISEDTIRSSKLMDYYNSRTDDDNFRGSYQDLEVIIDETQLVKHQGKHSYTIFSGLLIQIDMKKRFTGKTIILPEYDVSRNKIANLQEVKLEDPDFSKKYKVYSTDQVEARYIMTTAFIERFKKIESIYSSHEVKANFENNCVLFAISTHNMFEIVDLATPLDKTSNYEKFFLEFCALFELINELKLNQNIGL